VGVPHGRQIPPYILETPGTDIQAIAVTIAIDETALPESGGGRQERKPRIQGPSRDPPRPPRESCGLRAASAGAQTSARTGALFTPGSSCVP